MGRDRNIISDELKDNEEYNENLFFYDDISDDISDILYDKYKVIRSIKDLRNHFTNYSPEFNLGVGGPKIRSTLFKKISRIGGVLSSITSKFALIGNHNVNLDQGLTIMEFAIIENDTSIGKGSLINKFSIIAHDVNVGKFCEISLGSKLLGGASVGDYAQKFWIISFKF